LINTDTLAVCGEGWIPACAGMTRRSATFSQLRQLAISLSQGAE
jgi:hypothetical protein